MSSKIEWTEKALEVTGGCTKCSPGCQECWAINQVWRLAHNSKLSDKWQGLVEKKDGKLNWTGKIKMFEDALNVPLKRHKPTTYFVDSKSDIFHPKVPFEFIRKVFKVARACPQHTFQVLTKRIKRACEFSADTVYDSNIHFGTTICTQKESDENIPYLLRISTRGIRFISIEPLLSSVDMPEMLPGHYWYDWEKGCLIDWVIIGAEKIGSRGVGRECKLEWVESIVDQCKAAGTPVFVKQIHRDGKLVKMPPEFPQEYPKETK